MGTTRGEIRGKTKAEVWEKYQTAKIREGGVFLVHYPSNRKKAASQMKKDPKTDEWVLKFIFTM